MQTLVAFLPHGGQLHFGESREVLADCGERKGHPLLGETLAQPFTLNPLQ
ncbi:MAG: hypothetical protein AB1511_14390 [Deinococcota bacterium]